MRGKQEYQRKGSTQIDYHKFIKKFKTQLCPLVEYHSEDSCFYYHLNYQQSSLLESGDYHSFNNEPQLISTDKRRSPYSKMNQILYEPKMCQNKYPCINNQCSLCHNLWQYNFHPYIFKTIVCQNFYQCPTIYCHKLHYCDYKINPKNNIPIFSFSQFFRFDLNSFKTQQCRKQYSHDKNLCLFYHNSKDFRRNNFADYDHILCQKEKCQDRNCPFSHNKIQQLYHPSRYKSKYCEKYFTSKKKPKRQNNQEGSKSFCPYNQFCSFAHNDDQLSIQLIHKLPRTLEFHLYSYKTVWCPITTDHNRSQCVYAHNIQDYRRNPKLYHYQPEQCPDWKKNESIKGLQDAGCPRQMNCQKCHGWKQKQYHPIIFSKSKPMIQYKLKQKQKSQSFTSSQGNKQITIQSQPRAQKTNNIDLVNKKLGTVNGQNNNKLQLIINKQLQGNRKQFYQPGTPFFKNSKSTKTKSKSEKGQLTIIIGHEQKFSHVVQKGSVYTLQSLQFQNDNRINQMDLNFQNQIFKAFQLKNCDKIFPTTINTMFKYKGSSQNGQQQQQHKAVKNQQRSKSLGIKKKISSNCFSNQFTDVLDIKTINILKQKKINQIKLINMAEQEIKKIEELSKSQKNLLILAIRKSKLYNDHSPNYTRNLQKFFLSHKRKNILQKMKIKRVKQKKLLLLDSQIKQLSFLTQSQKNELPSIIKQFTNHQQFDSIKEDIEQSIKSQDQNL